MYFGCLKIWAEGMHESYWSLALQEKLCIFFFRVFSENNTNWLQPIYAHKYFVGKITEGLTASEIRLQTKTSGSWAHHRVITTKYSAHSGPSTSGEITPPGPANRTVCQSDSPETPSESALRCPPLRPGVGPESPTGLQARSRGLFSLFHILSPLKWNFSFSSSKTLNKIQYKSWSSSMYKLSIFLKMQTNQTPRATEHPRACISWHSKTLGN